MKPERHKLHLVTVSDQRRKPVATSPYLNRPRMSYQMALALQQLRKAGPDRTTPPCGDL